MGVKIFFRDSPDRGTVSEERRLRVLRRRQLFGGSFEAESTYIRAECGVYFTEDAACDGKCFG
jgi:hypothetical protein